MMEKNQEHQRQQEPVKDVISRLHTASSSSNQQIRSRCASCDSRTGSSKCANNYNDNVVKYQSPIKRLNQDSEPVIATETSIKPSMYNVSRDQSQRMKHSQLRGHLSTTTFRNVSAKAADSNSVSDVNNTSGSSSDLNTKQESNHVVKKSAYLPTFTEFKPLETNAKSVATTMNRDR